MKSPELFKLIDIYTTETNLKPTIVGSQSTHATLTILPEIVALSSEVDILMIGLTRELRTHIEDSYGVFSDFRDEFGAHIDTIGLATVVLPPNWQDRLVPLSAPSGNVVANCIDLYDLSVSKFFAGREKDLVFLSGLVESDRLDLSILFDRIRSMFDSPHAGAIDDRISRLKTALKNSNISGEQLKLVMEFESEFRNLGA